VPPSPWSPLPRHPPPGCHYPSDPLPHLLDPALPPRPAPPPCLPARPLLLLVSAADGTGAGAPATARYPRLRGHLRSHAAPAASTARYPRPRWGRGGIFGLRWIHLLFERGTMETQLTGLTRPTRMRGMVRATGRVQPWTIAGWERPTTFRAGAHFSGGS